MARFNHRAPQKFLALVAIGATERRAQSHAGDNDTGHDVIMPMLGTMPTG